MSVDYHKSLSQDLTLLKKKKTLIYQPHWGGQAEAH